MLLSKIGKEFEKLKDLLGSEKLFKDSYVLFNEAEYKNILLSWGADMRRLTRIEASLEKMQFESKAVQAFVDTYYNCIRDIFFNYDRLTQNIPSSKEEGLQGYKEENQRLKNKLSSSIDNLHKTFSNIETASNVVSTIIDETWEPLPDDKQEENVNNIIVSSETRSMSLNDVSSDVDYLNRFFNSICSLICQDKNEDNNIYLRKVETGSLTVAVSCVIGTAPIIAFMFWVIKLCQDTAERSLNIEEKSLNNKEKKLKMINDEIDTAKKILELQPDNKLADELVQGCAIHFFDFLENNPTGTINGEHYDIGMEKPKIEDKENK